MIDYDNKMIMEKDAEDCDTAEELGEYMNEFTSAAAGIADTGKEIQGDIGKLQRAQRCANMLRRGEMGLEEGLRRFEEGNYEGL